MVGPSCANRDAQAVLRVSSAKNQHSRRYDRDCRGTHVALGHGFRHEIVALWIGASKFGSVDRIALALVGISR